MVNVFDLSHKASTKELATDVLLLVFTWSIIQLSEAAGDPDHQAKLLVFWHNAFNSKPGEKRSPRSGVLSTPNGPVMS